ncbi:MAG: exosortase [Phycisphaera sp.]|nr:exosortase [Phycisphaera sp.]
MPTHPLTKRSVIVWTLLSAAALVASADAWVDVWRLAGENADSGHVYLAPIIAAWLLWVRRHRLKELDGEGRWVALPIVVFAAAMSLVAYHASVQSLWHLSSVLLLVSCAVAVMGVKALTRFAPVWLVMCFVVPTPGIVRTHVSLPLQTATAQATQAVLGAVGLDVVRSGNLLSFNGQAVAVAEACNGLRMVTTLVLVVLGFVFSRPMRPGARAAMVLLSPALAIVFNVARLAPLVLLYGWGYRELASTVHDISGYLIPIFAFAFLWLGVWGFDRVLSKRTNWTGARHSGLAGAAP